MQANTITLSVDVDRTATPVDEVFTRFDYQGNWSEYRAANHAVDARNMFRMYRTLPKISGNYKGSAKSALKFTFDQEVETVDGGVTDAPIILELSASVPVGTTAANLIHALERMAAALKNTTVIDGLIADQSV